MSTIAIATLQTPWDCKWSRFGRMAERQPERSAEGLWVCVYSDGSRRPIQEWECETCPHWEYEPPQARVGPAIEWRGLGAVAGRNGGSTSQSNRETDRDWHSRRGVRTGSGLGRHGVRHPDESAGHPAHHQPVDGSHDLVPVRRLGALQSTGSGRPVVVARSYLTPGHGLHYT